MIGYLVPTLTIGVYVVAWLLKPRPRTAALNVRHAKRRMR
jgi:hypothetical protein